MIKIIIKCIAILILTSCSNNSNILTIKNIVDNISKYEDETVTVKGGLKIYEMGYISLFLASDHGVLIDLAINPENLPNGIAYVPGENNCVVLTGTFKQYSNDFLAFNMRSEYGRIAVESIKLCEQQKITN